MFQPGPVQAQDAVRGQQVPVGDHARDHSSAANLANDQVQVGVQERLAAADSDDGSAQGGQSVDPLEHGLGGDGLGVVIVFVAVGAGKVAASHGNDVRQNGVVGREQALRNHAELAGAAIGALDPVRHRKDSL